MDELDCFTPLCACAQGVIGMGKMITRSLARRANGVNSGISFDGICAALE